MTYLNVFTNRQVFQPPDSAKANDEDCYFCFFTITQVGADSVCAVYSALGITIGLLPDMYVLSGLISTLVCSLRPKGQVTDKKIS